MDASAFRYRTGDLASPEAAEVAAEVAASTMLGGRLAWFS
jgi:hypothetical protein